MHGNSLVGRGVVDPEAGKGRFPVQNQPLTWGDVELRELVTGIEPALSVGLPHAGKTAEITVGSDTYQIRIEDDGIVISAPRKTSRDIKRHKASNYPERSPASP